MKKLSLLFLTLILWSQVAFGACEEERMKRDRATQLFEDWRKKSESKKHEAAACDSDEEDVGVVDAGVGKRVDLCSGRGDFVYIAFGFVEKRFKCLCHYFEEVLRLCEESQNNQEVEAGGRKNSEDNNSFRKSFNKSFNWSFNSCNSDCLSPRFMRSRSFSQQNAARSEIDDKIHEYVHSIDSLNDPDVLVRFYSELEAIECKYF